MTRYVTGEFFVPDEDARYRLYRLCECAACDGRGKIAQEWIPAKQPPYRKCEDCRGEGRTRELVAAATDPESLGVALVTLGREGEWEGCPIGILDTMGATGEKWIVRPWTPSARNVSDAGRTLAKARKT